MDFVQRNISQNISKDFKISQGTFMGTFLITIYIMGEQWIKFIHMDENGHS